MAFFLFDVNPLKPILTIIWSDGMLFNRNSLMTTPNDDTSDDKVNNDHFVVTECIKGCHNDDLPSGAISKDKSWHHNTPQFRVNPFSLHWRHNDHDGVSNHQPHGCLLNRLFRRKSKRTSKLRVTGLCVGNSRGPVNSPHKGPVTQKMFPFDDVIILNVICHEWDMFRLRCTKWGMANRKTRKRSASFWWRSRGVLLWIHHVH